MPDWRNAEDYAFVDNLTPEGKAWEFLRRNPEYRSGYQELSLILEILNINHGPIDDPTVEIDPQRVPDAFHYEPPRNQSENVSEWQKRCTDEELTPRVERIDIHYGYQWGIDGPMQDPFAEGEPTPKFWGTFNWPRMVTFAEFSHYFNNESREQAHPLVLVGLNLNLDIKRQVSKLDDELAALKKQLKSDGLINKLSNIGQIDHLRDHLRLLDADAEGAKTAEIGKCLFPEIKDPKGRLTRVYDRRKAAKRFRDKDYRLIPIRMQKT